MRMIAGGHRSTANGRANAHMTLATRFPQLDIAVVQITDLADGGVADLANQANFTRRQADLSVVTFFRQELSSGASGANQLTTLAFFQLDIVDHRADRNIGNRQAVAWADIRLSPQS